MLPSVSTAGGVTAPAAWRVPGAKAAGLTSKAG